MKRFSRASSGAILACLLISACVSPPVEIIDRVHVPKGTIDTTDRSIELQERKDFYVPELAVWVSNQFPGARVNGVSLGSNGALAVQIKPENAPINDSPWFAFKLWREGAQMPVEVVLHYTDGTHRYTPKISTDGHVWSDLPADSVTVAEDKSEARFMVEVGPEPLWVAAQEVVAASSVEAWLAGLQRRDARACRKPGTQQMAPQFPERTSEQRADRRSSCSGANTHPR